VVDSIFVSGNQYLKTEEILGSIDLAPGDTVSAGVLERERIRLLQAHRTLLKADFLPRPGSRRGSIILEVDVVERKRFSFETGYGYHDTNGWFLTLAGLRVDPLYRTDSMLRLGFRLGFNLTSLDVEWEKPAPVTGGLGANARLFVQNEERRFFGSCGGADPASEPASCSVDGTEWFELRQDIGRVRGEASTLYWVGGTRFSFGIGLESVRPESTFHDAEHSEDVGVEDLPEAIAQDIEETLITGLFLRVNSDTRNDVVYPAAGSVLFFSIEANTTLLGGDQAFTRVVADYRKLIDLGGNRVLAGRLSAGVTSTGTPYYERFAIGGIYSIRGFRELSLSPVSGDDGYWIASCELRFPLITSVAAPPRLSGLVFLDSGMGWRRDDTSTPETVEAAIGYGARLRLPWLGVLGVDVGIPLTEGRTGEKFQVHGALGFSF
jgi:outer membrane protein assembly factor BamA